MSGPEPSDSAAGCSRVTFYGRVQGVGFRYTTARIAKCFPIKGYVRNCADGTVELVAQGPGGQVERLLERIAEEFVGYIDHQKREEIPATEPFDGFEIRR